MFDRTCENLGINTLSKEKESLEMYTSKIQDEYIKNRIDHILSWYINKATFYKRLFYTLSVILLVINASIPFINQLGLDDSPIIITGISTIATIITGILTLFTMKDTWFRYRNHVELIKSQCSLFNGQVGIYSKDNREKQLIRNIESIIDDERGLWKLDKFKEENDNKGEDNDGE
ncbi:DUF4231 domain-containing protein [Romboutsia lituseburensis]|uniref:DUF4231 domain-containing protein n=1 Tax=Romboutsia lituseburensis TaxID=1537 RepID=UPI00215B0E4D|nr:DUF4231 domain-containing protein [Romboutsia lituseburensis]MCR8744298.1 DUF4231 domain-containing protein [Romboutsia lituseburensis]